MATGKQVQFRDDPPVVIPRRETSIREKDDQTIVIEGIEEERIMENDDFETSSSSVLFYTQDELLDMQEEIDFLLDHFDSLQQQQQPSICWRGLEDAKERKDFRFRYRNQVLDRHEELRKEYSHKDMDEKDIDDTAHTLQLFAVALSLPSLEEARKRAIQDADDAKSILHAIA